MTAADPTASTLTATPKKFAGLTVVSNELLADSDPAILDAVAQDLVAQIGRKLDLGLFEGTGSNNQPTGLKATSGINEVSMGTNGEAPSDLSKIADAIYELQTDNAVPTALVLHPRTLGTLRKLNDTTGRSLLVPPTDPG
ncbi:MAG: phage major capsid protein, partial [Actinomycetota bacterium]